MIAQTAFILVVFAPGLPADAAAEALRGLLAPLPVTVAVHPRRGGPKVLRVGDRVGRITVYVGGSAGKLLGGSWSACGRGLVRVYADTVRVRCGGAFAMALARVAAHEIGHVCGLRHSKGIMAFRYAATGGFGRRQQERMRQWLNQ